MFKNKNSDFFVPSRLFFYVEVTKNSVGDKSRRAKKKSFTTKKCISEKDRKQCPSNETYRSPSSARYFCCIEWGKKKENKRIPEHFDWRCHRFILAYFVSRFPSITTMFLFQTKKWVMNLEKKNTMPHE